VPLEAYRQTRRREGDPPDQEEKDTTRSSKPVCPSTAKLPAIEVSLPLPSPLLPHPLLPAATLMLSISRRRRPPGAGGGSLLPQEEEEETRIASH
jgi:hypothetical protein